MVDKISEAKAKVLERMERTIGANGVERMDVAEMGKLADIVKDLSEAEKECWEAQYYMAVTSAMSGAGGSSGGHTSQGYMPEPMGYDAMRGTWDGRSGYRDSMGRYTTRPYTMGYGYDMQGLRDAMGTASPEEREKMQRELRVMLGM